MDHFRNDLRFHSKSEKTHRFENLEIMSTWQPITPDSPIKEGDYIGGYDSHIKWRRAKVKRCNAEQRIYLVDFMLATHWTSDAPPYELPKAPKTEDCKIMELAF
jgi:hypothetical protein